MTAHKSHMKFKFECSQIKFYWNRATLIRLPVICGFCTPSDGGAVAAGPRPAPHCRGRAADRSHTATPPPRPRAPHSAPAGLRIPSITAAHACRGGTGSAGFPRSGSEDGWSGFCGSQVRRQSVKFILQGQGSSAEKTPCTAATLPD